MSPLPAAGEQFVQRSSEDEEAPAGPGIAPLPEVPFNWMVLPFPMGLPQAGDPQGEQLEPEEVERRRQLVEASAQKAAKDYPIAADLLVRWLARDPSEVNLEIVTELLGEQSPMPIIARGPIRERLRQGVESRLDENHSEHFQPGQGELHLRALDSFEFIGAGQDPATLTRLQKDLSIALGGVTYTVDAHLGLAWSGDQLTTATVTAAKISIVDRYDFNLGDVALIPLPGGTTMPASFLPGDMGVVPLPPGITLEDLPVPDEVLSSKESMTIADQEWIAVKDDWMSSIALSGGATDFPIRIDPFDIPAEYFPPITVTGKTAH